MQVVPKSNIFLCKSLVVFFIFYHLKPVGPYALLFRQKGGKPLSPSKALASGSISYLL